MQSRQAKLLQRGPFEGRVRCWGSPSWLSSALSWAGWGNIVEAAAMGGVLCGGLKSWAVLYARGGECHGLCCAAVVHPRVCWCGEWYPAGLVGSV